MNPEDLKDLSRVERLETLFDFSPFKYQAELVKYGESNDVAKAAVKPGRQVGKTVTGGAIAAERALSGHDVMILGPYETTVDEMREAAINHLLTAEEKFQEAGLELGTEKRNQTDWQFEHNGRLRAQTVGTNGTQLRGKNPDIVLVDEAAYIKNTIYTEVIDPFFSTHPNYEYYLFSTPAGKSGFFYDAVDGKNAEHWFSPHWPSIISPLIDDEWIDKKRRENDSLTFQQEYLGEFVDEGDTLFGHEQITALTADTELSGRVWLGVDIAREGKDRTVYTAMDEHGTAKVLDSEETSTMDGVLGRIKDLHRTYGFEAAIVEENSIGGGVVDFGKDLEILEPFKSSTKSKHNLYKSLQKAIESEDVTLPNDRRLVDELTSLQYEFTQHSYMKVHHPEGGHDDFADSLAFANWGRTGGDTPTVTRRKANVSMHKGR